MPAITLVSTFHGEKGACTSDALLRILEALRPDVLFLEIPPASKDRVLRDESNLETCAVRQYLKADPSAASVPVDIMEAPGDLVAAYERLHRECRAKNREYAGLFNTDLQRIEQYGFAYLNSKYCVEHWTALDREITAAIPLMKNAREEHSQTYARWNQTHAYREREMMKNIRAYCEDHPFNAGVFLLGAAHRRAIMEMALSVPVSGATRIVWNFDRYDGVNYG